MQIGSRSLCSFQGSRRTGWVAEAQGSAIQRPLHPPGSRGACAPHPARRPGLRPSPQTVILSPCGLSVHPPRSLTGRACARAV